MGNIFITAAIFVAIPSVLMAPLVAYARIRTRPDSWLVPFCHVPAVAMSYFLMAMRVGQPQSLGSIIEFIIIDVVAILVAYIKVVVIDGKFGRPKMSTLLLTIALVGLAFLLRVFMAPLQE